MKETVKKNRIIQTSKQIICLLVGLFILALGIAMSAKSGLGVGPTSSVPYVISVLTPLSMGTLTLIMNCLFALLQIVILRKNYKPVYLLQLAVVFFFSFFTDFTLFLLQDVVLEQYWMKILMCIASCLVMGVGVFLEVKANLLTMATEGLISAIANVFKLDFGLTKMIFDWGMVVITAVISLVAFHGFVGVREGTIIAAFLVGYVVRFLNRYFKFVDKWISSDADVEEEILSFADTYPLVITIEREWGSGGHEIGERVAKKLGIPFYDYNIISKTAEKMGVSEDIVQKKEQKLGAGLVHHLYNQNYYYTNEHSIYDQIFRKQQDVIREFANAGSCVIVGRLGSYALKERPNCLHIFMSGDHNFRNARIAEEMNVDIKTADSLRKKEDLARIHHCSYFTGEPWGLAVHYGLCLNTAMYGIERSCEIILDAISKKEIPQNN